MTGSPLRGEEEWRVISGFSRFEASNLGRIRSLYTTRNTLRPEPLIKKQYPAGRDERPHVMLSPDGKRPRPVTVGRAVCLAFHGPQPAGKEASHLDGNPHNNAPENMAWETHAENMARQADHGTIPKGSRHGMAKLHERDIPVIMRLIRAKVPQTVIAAAFRVSDATIVRIKRGEGWCHLAA